MSPSQIHLLADKLGKNSYADPPQEALDLTNRLLQHNHDELHIFFRDMNGHNHLVHNLLTRLVLGATPAQLQVAYDDDLPTQRAMPALDEEVVRNLSDDKFFFDHITQIAQYTNFLSFFEKQIETKGWRAVVNEYVFSRSRIADALLPLMFDGAYHPIIHLGLGIEFEQPSVIAEGLAQAAAHDSFETDFFFLTTERASSSSTTGTISSKEKTLVELIREIASTPSLLHAGRVPGLIGTMKMKRAIFSSPAAAEDMVALASQFRVTPQTLQKRTAEVLNLCAYLAAAAAAAAQRAGYAPKIDFFFMHCVTSSIFLSVLVGQDWIAVEDKVRLVEWKGRLDLVWYVVCGLPELDLDAVVRWKGDVTGEEMGWTELFEVVNEQHDDGHVAKFARALKNGEEVCREFEAEEGFLVKGDLWLRIARMAYESTLNTTPQTRWVVMAGMESAWAAVPRI